MEKRDFTIFTYEDRNEKLLAKYYDFFKKHYLEDLDSFYITAEHQFFNLIRENVDINNIFNIFFYDRLPYYDDIGLISYDDISDVCNEFVKMYNSFLYPLYIHKTDETTTFEYICNGKMIDIVFPIYNKDKIDEKNVIQEIFQKLEVYSNSRQIVSSERRDPPPIHRKIFTYIDELFNINGCITMDNYFIFFSSLLLLYSAKIIPRYAIYKNPIDLEKIRTEIYGILNSDLHKSLSCKPNVLKRCRYVQIMYKALNGELYNMDVVNGIHEIIIIIKNHFDKESIYYKHFKGLIHRVEDLIYNTGPTKIVEEKKEKIIIPQIIKHW